MPKPKRKCDWEGRYVRLRVPLQNKGGGVFPQGTVMQVHRNYGGLMLKAFKACNACKSQGWSVIRRVSEHDVDLLPEEYRP